MPVEENMARGTSPNPLPRIENAITESTGGRSEEQDTPDVLRFSWQLNRTETPGIYSGTCTWIEKHDQCIVSIRSMETGLQYSWSPTDVHAFLREVNLLTTKQRQRAGAFIYEEREVRYRLIVSNEMGRRTATKIVASIERAVRMLDEHVWLFKLFIKDPAPPTAKTIKDSLKRVCVVVH